MNFKMKTSKNIKKENVIQQMAYIAASLDGEHENGDASITYVGVIYEEVKDFFVNKGFEFMPINNEQLIARTGGKPVTLIKVSSNIILTDEELEEAREEYNKVLDFCEGITE